METNEKIARVKRSFYTFRNGVVADVMRRSGTPFRVVFGLTLPQVSDIAREIGEDVELGALLWNDSDVRESMMLAPMLMNVSEFTVDDALAWTETLRSTEIADVLALKLLRRMDSLPDAVDALCRPGCSPLQRYAGLRAAFGLTATHPDLAGRLAGEELARKEAATVSVARQLLDVLACQA